jgi:hypothetical protein
VGKRGKATREKASEEPKRPGEIGGCGRRRMVAAVMRRRRRAAMASAAVKDGTRHVPTCCPSVSVSHSGFQALLHVFGKLKKWGLLGSHAAFSPVNVDPCCQKQLHS